MWPRIVIIGLMLATLFVSRAWAEKAEYNEQVLQNAATADGNGSPMAVDRFSAVALDITISGTATVNFEGSVIGTTATAITCTSTADGISYQSISASGMVQCNTAGFKAIQARISGCSSCTVTVYARATTAILGKAGSGSGVSTLQQAFAGGHEITGANSEVNCFKVGDGTRGFCIWGDATDGAVIKPFPLSDTVIRAWTDKNIIIRDVEGAKDAVIFDADAIGAGSGTLTMQTSEQFVASNLGIEFTESDTNPTCSANNYNIYADTSEAAVKMCRNGLAVQLPSGGVIRKASDTVINNDNTVNNDPALVLAVEANSNYVFKLFVKYSATTVADFRFDFTVPAGATGTRLDRYAGTSITDCSAGNTSQHNVVAIDVQNNNLGGENATAHCVLVVEGDLSVAGTAGNFQFRWAQANLEATDATVWTGSYLEWRKL